VVLPPPKTHSITSERLCGGPTIVNPFRARRTVLPAHLFGSRQRGKKTDSVNEGGEQLLGSEPRPRAVTKAGLASKVPRTGREKKRKKSGGRRTGPRRGLGGQTRANPLQKLMAAMERREQPDLPNLSAGRSNMLNGAKKGGTSQGLAGLTQGAKRCWPSRGHEPKEGERAVANYARDA